MLPGGGYGEHAAHEAEPVADWLDTLGVHASLFRYPVHVRHPLPLDALRAEVRRRRDTGADRVGVIGFSAGGHLAGPAALAPSSDPRESPDFVVLGYAITSMETQTYRPSRTIPLGEDVTPGLRCATSLDALVTPSSPPLFLLAHAEDIAASRERTTAARRLISPRRACALARIDARSPTRRAHPLGGRRRRRTVVELGRPTPTEQRAECLVADDRVDSLVGSLI